MAVGAANGIIIGQMLGANKLEESKDAAYKLIAVSFVISLVVALAYAISAEFIPLAYNTESEIRHLATRMMQLTAVARPFDAITHAAYFTLRSGGKTMITFIFDSGFIWAISFTTAFFLTKYTGIQILPLYIIVQLADFIKVVVSVFLLKSGIWVNNLTGENKKKEKI